MFRISRILSAEFELEKKTLQQRAREKKVLKVKLFSIMKFLAKEKWVSKNSQSHLKVFKLDFDAILQAEPENLKLYSCEHLQIVFLFELVKDIYPNLGQIAIIYFVFFFSVLRYLHIFKDILKGTIKGYDCCVYLPTLRRYRKCTESNISNFFVC